MPWASRWHQFYNDKFHLWKDWLSYRGNTSGHTWQGRCTLSTWRLTRPDMHTPKRKLQKNGRGIHTPSHTCNARPVCFRRWHLFNDNSQSYTNMSFFYTRSTNEIIRTYNMVLNAFWHAHHSNLLQRKRKWMNKSNNWIITTKLISTLIKHSNNLNIEEAQIRNLFIRSFLVFNTILM